MENYERDPVDFFRPDSCPAAFAAAVPKNHLPPDAVRPVGAGTAAAADPGESACPASQCADSGGACAGAGRPAAGTAGGFSPCGAGAAGAAPGSAGRRAGCWCCCDPSRRPGGFRRLGCRHGHHRRPLPPTDGGGDPDVYLVRRHGGDGSLVFDGQRPFCSAAAPEPETIPGSGLQIPGVSGRASAVPLFVRGAAACGLPDPRRRGIPGDIAARSGPRDYPRPPSGPPVEPAAVRVSGCVLVRSAGVDRRRCLPPGLRAGLRRGCAETAGGGGTHPLWPDAAAADPRSPDAGKPHAFRHHHDGGKAGVEGSCHPHRGKPPHHGRRPAGDGDRRRAGMRPHLHRGKALRAVSDRRGAVRVRAGVQHR